MNNIVIDSCFKIGASHSVCEDYSWSGLIQDEYPCIIISDGCSSSKNTDIGARVMVRAMIYTLERLKLEKNTHEQNFHLINHLLGDTAKHNIELMDLPLSTLDATMLMVININEEIFIFNYGDGSVILRNHTTGEIFPRLYTDYPYNAPYYYSYTLSDSNREKYISLYGEESIVSSGKTLSVMDHINDYEQHWGSIPIKDLDDGVWSISVMSDGVETFFKGNDNIDTEDVIKDITAFKNFRGEFVQRKVGMFLSRHAKNNIQHYDDISVSSMVFELKSGKNLMSTNRIIIQCSLVFFRYYQFPNMVF